MHMIIPLGFLVMVAGYLVFLAALWVRINRESDYREGKLNSLLDSMPKVKPSDESDKH